MLVIKKVQYSNTHKQPAAHEEFCPQWFREYVSFWTHISGTDSPGSSSVSVCVCFLHNLLCSRSCPVSLDCSMAQSIAVHTPGWACAGFRGSSSQGPHLLHPELFLQPSRQCPWGCSKCCVCDSESFQKAPFLIVSWAISRWYVKRDFSDQINLENSELKMSLEVLECLRAFK